MSITKSKYDCNNCGRTMGSEACKHCITSDDPFCMPTQWVVKNDMVNHPDHYQTETGLETIDVIEAFTEGLDGIEAVCTANVIKYICRWKKKNGIEDLRKAEWYLQRLIRHMELVVVNDKTSKSTTTSVRIDEYINKFRKEGEK